MSEATGFRNKVRDYLKFRPVKTKGERIVVWILIPVVVLIALMFWGIPPLHVIPVWGPSMQPTMQVWSLPAPLERFSFSGWIHYDPTTKPEVGSIVYFRVPNTKIWEVKRVSEVNDLGLLYLQPDNTGVSGEGSDNSELYKWLCPESVIGVVDEIGTPARVIHWLTPRGRQKNWANIHSSSATWGPESYWVGHQPGRFSVYHNRTKLATLTGEFEGWRDGCILYRTSRSSGGYKVLAFDPTTLSDRILKDVQLTAFTTTFHSWKVYGHGANTQDPLAPFDDDPQTTWATESMPDAYWVIDLGQNQSIEVHIWAGSSGVTPYLGGWTSSSGTRWTPVHLTPGDNQSATTTVTTRFLKFQPSSNQPAGLMELDIKPAG